MTNIKEKIKDKINCKVLLNINSIHSFGYALGYLTIKRRMKSVRKRVPSTGIALYIDALIPGLKT